MTQTFAVSLTELQYVHGTSSKFYRVYFVNSSTAKAQYGKIGTYGVFLDRTPSDAYALISAKQAKGYSVVRIIDATFDHKPTESELNQWAVNGYIKQTVVLPEVADVDLDDIDVDDIVEIEEPVTHVTLVEEPHVTCQGMNEIDLEAQMESAPFQVVAEIEVKVVAATPMPMLAHNAEPEHLEFMLASADWGMQAKVDGDRVMIEIANGEVKAFGRNGQAKVSNISPAMLAPFKVFSSLGRFVFDGEIVGQTIWLFDLPVATDIFTTSATFDTRYTILKALVAALNSPKVQLVPLVTTEDAKRELLAAQEANHKEGVMFRGLYSKYVVGRSTNLLKHKFVKTMDCIVVATGLDGHNSATLAVFNHQGIHQVVGSASTIGKNKHGGGIKVGQVVEVKFLYIVNPDDPRLYQPRIVKVRTDKAAAECSIDQLIGTHTDKAVL